MSGIPICPRRVARPGQNERVAPASSPRWELLAWKRELVLAGSAVARSSAGIMSGGTQRLPRPHLRACGHCVGSARAASRTPCRRWSSAAPSGFPSLARSQARRPNAPWRLWYSDEALQSDVDRTLQFLRVVSTMYAKTPRWLPRAHRAGLLADSKAITGQEASRTISDINSSACSEESPSPTSATSGCTCAVTEAISLTSTSRAITSWPSRITT